MPQTPTFKPLHSRYGALTFALLAVQQGMIAASAWFLTEALRRFQNGDAYTWPLGVYLVLMVLPWVPGCLSFVSLRAWVNHVHAGVIDAMVASVARRVAHYTDGPAKAAFESALSRNAFNTVNEYLSLSHDFFALLLNSVLSALVLGLVLPTELLAGYLFSLAACALLIAVLGPRLQARSTTTEAHFARYGQRLGEAWPNAVLGNPYNFQLWQQHKRRDAEAYYHASLRLAARQQAANLAIAMASLLPTLYLLYHLLLGPGIEPALVAAVIVNLTRVFHILGALSTLVYQVLAWRAARARLQWLNLQAAPAQARVGSLNGTVFINGAAFHSIKTACAALAAAEPGRYTVRGANGVGKTSLLLALKAHWGDAAWYIPATPQVLCWASDSEAGSTGQKVRAVFTELAAAPQLPAALLLDEWDANLDAAYAAQISQWLDTTSKAHTVVEVRH